jgi:hypothetical protein
MARVHAVNVGCAGKIVQSDLVGKMETQIEANYAQKLQKASLRSQILAPE